MEYHKRVCRRIEKEHFEAAHHHFLLYDDMKIYEAVVDQVIR